MKLVNNQFFREKLQINLFKALICMIAVLAFVFLIKNEGFFFGIH